MIMSEGLFTTDFYTIGYEGWNVYELIQILEKYLIKTVVDIRSIPYSAYNKQYSKNNLSEVLRFNKIDYYHAKTLGNPKRFWDKKDWKILYGNMIKPLLPSLLKEFKKMKPPLVLLCREKHPENCHRIIVANELAKHGFIGKHLRNIH